MLCMHSGEWTHLNCVYYNSSVSLKENDNTIQKYQQIKSRPQTCYICNKTGASIRCSVSSCSQSFHFVCGRHHGCLITLDRTAYCAQHNPNHSQRTLSSFAGSNSMALNTRMRPTNLGLSAKGPYRSASMNSASGSSLSSMPASNRSAPTTSLLHPQHPAINHTNAMTSGVGVSNNISDYLKMVNEMDLFTTRYNYRVVFGPPRLYV